MAQQTINVGTAPNDGTGTPLRTAFQYTNSNFSELYTAVGPSGNNIVVPGNATITGDLTVDTSTLKVDSANNRVGINTASPQQAFEVVAAGINTIFNTASAADSRFELRNNNVRAGYVYWDTSEVRLFADTSRALTFYQNGTLGMTLNSTGLGVGVASPTSKLTIGTGSYSAAASGTTGMYTTASGLEMLSDSYFFGSRTGGVLMTLTAAGNLGIGVTPSAWNSDYRALQVSSSGSYVTSYISGATVNQWLFIGNNAFYDSVDSRWEYIRSKPSAQYIQYNNEHQWLRDTGTQTAGAACTFTQAMTLTADGELLVGTASVGGVFDTKFYLSSNSGTNKWAVGPYGTATNFAIIPTPGTGGVYLSGTSATSWTAYSDERLKDIIEPITNALTKVGSLRSVIGKFKGDEANTRRPFLIAQDLQSALPEAVDASNPDRLGVAYTDVIPLLVAAIKELAAEVNALKNA